ncbi:MAG: TiaS agmantine-binding domain-containing protein, partial [Candidatus Thorarchaeota archaeon]
MVLESIALGLDDIDSPNGGCTTHFVSLLVEKLHPKVEAWTDYPHLIRLNPNIPYRTRGNGGICLRFIVDSKEIDGILPLISGMIKEYADLTYPNTNPGVVLISDEIPSSVRLFSHKALWKTLPKSLALRIISDSEFKHLSYGNGRGLVGALAVVGHGLASDHTFEYLAYRKLSDSQAARGVEKTSVELMDTKMGDRVFSNIDPTNGTILIEPKGPDPVLYGIRGERPDDVIEAASYISSKQDVDRWMVFRTNQGTAEHLTHRLSLAQLRPYMSINAACKVAGKPRIIEGGHVIFKVADDEQIVDCAAYEPTGDFRWAIMKLREDDQIILYAGVRPASRNHDITLNVEGMLVRHLTADIQYSNPLCSQCGKRMKSAGK